MTIPTPKMYPMKRQNAVERMGDATLAAHNPQVSSTRKSVAKFSLLTLALLFLVNFSTFSQISGTKTIGATGDYPTLTAAFADITTQSLNGNIVLQLAFDYLSSAEPSFPIGAPTSGSIGSFTVNVYPTQGGLTIAGSSATGIINLSGTKNVTIDGRVNATGTTTDLVISNNDITTGYVVQFANVSTANTLKYCSIRGGSTTSTSGVVVFGSSASTGNNNNVISNCSIRDAGSGFPTIGIYALGNASFPNTTNTIDNCNIFNFFNAAAACQGINIGVGNTAWTITNNNLYQQTARTGTAGANVTHSGILISNTVGNNFTITDNSIGGSNINCGGTWTTTGGFIRFFAMNITVGNTTASSIQNNTIKNFNITTNYNASPVWAGMVLQNGSFNVGTVSGNFIGEPTGTGSVTVTMSNSAATVTTALATFGIWMTATVAASTYNIANNQIGSFTLDATTINHALGFEGIIASAGSATAINITSNTIGSTVTANSINSPTLSVTGAQLTRGIDVQNSITGGNINVAVNSNIVANMNQSSTLYSVSTGGTGANIRGIVVSPNAANGTVTVNSNQIYNISGKGATAPSFTSQGSESGIVIFATGSNLVTVADNVIHDISGTNSNATYYAVAGIVGSNAVSANFLRNRVYNLSNASTINSSTTPPIAAGFWFGASGGDYTYVNNMVTLGTGQTTNTMFCGFISAGNSGATRNLYYNTFNITGSAASGAVPSWGILRTASLATAFGAAASAGGSAIIIKDNLIRNNRNGGTGKHYALGNISASLATGWTTTASNYNILNSTSPSAMAAWGVNPGTDYTLASFRTLTGGDAASITGALVTFLDPANGDLHINMGVIGNQIESSGLAIAGYTTDFDGTTRPGPTTHMAGVAPDIGADEFDGVILDIAAPNISYTLLNNTSLVAGETLGNFATITDLGGVNGIIGTRPRLYYKRTTDANTFNDNTSGTTGWKYDEANGAGSPFTFTIDYTKLSGGAGVSIGSIIQYFVVAQDLASTPNIGINSGTFAVAPSSVALTSAAFPLTGTINTYNIVTAYAGTINVGISETITSLTNANGLFDKMNNGALTASLTVNITSDLTSESGTIGLNQLAEDGIGAGTYTLTIKPSGVARTVSGIPTGPSLLKLNGADRIIINGSLTPTGIDRSLTIANYSQDYDLGNISDNCVIHVSSPNSTNPATFNTIKNCIVRGLSNVGTEYAICQGGSDGGGDPGSGALAPNSNNTYQNNLIFASNFGIYFNGSSANPDQNNIIKGNTIGSPVTSLKTYFAGFWSQGEVGMQITDNSILGVVGNLSGAFAISGIFINSASTNSVITGNNIKDISNTSTTGGAAGMRLGAFGSSTNVLVANNTISDISCPGSAAAPTEINNSFGIAVTSAQQANTYKFYYNSINLNDNQTAGISAAFFTAAGVTLANAMDFRNNSIATAQTTNTRYAMYVAGGSNAIFSTINRNLYYTVAGGTLGFLTSARTTLGAWQTATGQDANSLNADPKYNTINILGPLVGSPLIAAGVTVAGVTKDQIGVTRSVSTPSIGAYELAGDYAAPIITYTALPFTCGTGNVTLVANITDFTGVNITAVNKPRIYFKKNSGSYFSTQGLQVGGSATNGTWNFTINTTTLGGVTVGDKISYFVIAQDVTLNINVGTGPVGGFGSDVNAVTEFPPAVDSFLISTALAPGTYTVGGGGNYATLTAAIADYNTKCLSGAVTFTLLNASYTTGTGETMPLNIAANPYASSTNTLTIKPATAVNSTITGATADVLRLNGSDYVTIDGSNNGTTSKNLTLAGTSITSGADVIFMISLGAGKGATHNTVKNCTFQNGSKGTGANAGAVTTFYNIYSGNITGGQGPDNDYLTLDNNTFKFASIGVFASSNATGILNNWVVTNNTFGDAVTTASTLARTGFSINSADNLTLSGNTFTNINTTDLGSTTGILLGATVSNATIRKNIFTDIKYTSTGSFGGRAIDINSGLAASNITIDHNSISNVSGAGSNQLLGDAVSGIRVLGTTDGVKIYYNSINLGSGTFAGNANGILSACVYIGATATGINLRDNILNSNLDNTGSANDKTYAVYSDAPSSAFTSINYNNYSTSGVGAGNLGFIGINRTNLAGIIAGFGGNANSTNATPLFTTPTNLHLLTAGNCAVDNKGTVIAGFTTDIDAQTRDIFYPDMGYDEFTSTDNQWIGTVSTAWNNIANWCSGVVPSSVIDVTIPSGTPFTPVLNLNGNVKGLTIATGTTLGLSTFTLNVAGALAGTGTFVAGTASKLVLTANGALGTLNVAAPGNIGSVTTSGTGATLTLGSTTNIYGGLDVAGNTLTAGGNLTLKSTVNGTAYVAPITGSGNIIGNVTVERFITQNGFRAWRLLSVPVKTGGSQSTFKTAWQEGQTGLTNTVPGYGTLLTNIAGNNGYDAATASNSLIQFTSGNPGSYAAVSNTTNSMVTNSGYFVYIRGDRTQLPFGGVTTTTSTTLRTNGPLYVGDQPSITLPANFNVLVGNVYASAIDFEYLRANGFVSGTSAFKVWDPKLGGMSGSGGYQTFSQVGGYLPTPGGGSYGALANSRIESGLAFILTSTTGGSITLKEASKVSGSKNVFRPTGAIQQLKTTLYSVENNTENLVDGNTVVFNSSFSNALDNDDVIKTNNPGENISIVNGISNLALEARKPVTESDVIALSVNNLKQQIYKLEILPSNLNTAVTAYLEDKYLGTKTEISLHEVSAINFKVDNNVASSASDRFRIVFKGTNPAITAIDDEANGSISILPTLVTEGKFNLQMTKMPAGKYTIRVLNSIGQGVYTSVINKSEGSSTNQITLTSSGLSGIYQVEVVSPSGKRSVQKILIK